MLSKEYKAQVKQLIEMNKIDVARGNISFNFTDNNLIKKIMVDKLTQTQLINGRLAIARLGRLTIMARASTPSSRPA